MKHDFAWASYQAGATQREGPAECLRWFTVITLGYTTIQTLQTLIDCFNIFQGCLASHETAAWDKTDGDEFVYLKAPKRDKTDVSHDETTEGSWFKSVAEQKTDIVTAASCSPLACQVWDRDASLHFPVLNWCLSKEIITLFFVVKSKSPAVVSTACLSYLALCISSTNHSYQDRKLWYSALNQLNPPPMGRTWKELRCAELSHWLSVIQHGFYWSIHETTTHLGPN